MVAVGLVILYGIHTFAVHSQRTGIGHIVNDIALAAAEHGGTLPAGQELQRWLDDLTVQYRLADRPMVLILNSEGRMVQAYPQVLPLKSGEMEAIHSKIISESAPYLKMMSDRDRPLIAAVAPIAHPSTTLGYAMYIAYEDNLLERFLVFSFPRMIGWLTVMLCGWAIIFAMIRHIVKPIQDVSSAAKQVVAGQYEVKLEKTYKEQEIHELMTSFGEMAEQLRQLEDLRAQLLAGVTHELKTPITVISGLTQALNDKVVTGEEAEQFLQHCVIECNRLKKMVDDLLHFNSFAASAIHVTKQPIDLADALRNVLERWRIAQEDLPDLSVSVHLEIEEGGGTWIASTDIERLEQIMINLLNNARDAMDARGAITVRLTAEREHFRMDIEDTGKGIAADDQVHIFEPFYRGSDKKMKVRGLGIGLPFSKMIAQSLGGQLLLSKSSPEGTCFSLLLPRGDDISVPTRI